MAALADVATTDFDLLRQTEYRRLDEAGHTYVDYTGGSLYAESQVTQHAELLKSAVFGNPHSGNPASLHMTDLVEQTRTHVLTYFNARADDYDVIFTPNATGALRLVGEAYPFDSLLLSADNHNSVNGLREFARRRGARVRYAPITPDELRLDEQRLMRLLRGGTGDHRLFAYPAQSNFSGVQHDLGWIDTVHERGWDVLLDASAFVPTNRLDLSATPADFVSLSFYKMFGYPTGVGALVARRSALQELQRPWFAGGTITLSSVAAAFDAGRGFYLTPGHAGFEDGTVNYLSLPAVDFGLSWLERIGIDALHTRVMQLTRWLLDELREMPHVRLYGPLITSGRGATIALNVHGFDCWTVEQLANRENISLRAGCHCNPGAREAALGLTDADLAPYFRAKHKLSYDQFVASIQPTLQGVVRVSLGIASNLEDVQRVSHFLAARAA